MVIICIHLTPDCDWFGYGLSSYYEIMVHVSPTKNEYLNYVYEQVALTAISLYLRNVVYCFPLHGVNSHCKIIVDHHSFGHPNGVWGIWVKTMLFDVLS